MDDAHLPALRRRSGVAGLDEVLGGGWTQRNVFLIEGEPGAGKTTIALQFLLEGERCGEKGLYVTLSETEVELRAGAASHGWTLGPLIDVFELVPPETVLDEEQQQSLLHASELELGEATRMLFEAVQRSQPLRVVIDSLSEIRLLAQSSLRYRRQILAIKHYFSRHLATVLLLDDLTADSSHKTVHSVAHGVLRLEQLAPVYGGDRRRLRVLKYRGQRFRGGYHDMNIESGGVRVFPRLVATERRAEFERMPRSSGNAELDALLGGGIDRGSSTIVLGPTGAGKSVLSLMFLDAAMARGERVALFVFEEELDLLFKRMRLLGIDLPGLRDAGMLIVEQFDAAEVSPGEFASRVCAAVEQHGAQTVLIDSLNGYQAAMLEETSLILHMRELLQYLNRQGASALITVAQHGLVGDMRTPVDVTYLADTVILMRYFEAYGTVRRALSIIKKRTGEHESTIREFRIGVDGTPVQVGAPLVEFQGVLRGVPEYTGEAASLLPDGAGAVHFDDNL